MIPQVSVILPIRNESENLELLLPRLHSVLGKIGAQYEIVAVDGNSDDASLETARYFGAMTLGQNGCGYGSALREGFAASSGEYIVTLDADLSHDPAFIHTLWENRGKADVVIASRYCGGGNAHAPIIRKILSRLLNRLFASGLGVPVADMSSGFRLYRAQVARRVQFKAQTFDALEEILVRIYADGHRIIEVPLTYLPRAHGTSKAKMFHCGLRLLITFVRMRLFLNARKE